LLTAGATAALAFSFSSDARALGPVDVEIAAMAGGGTTPTSRAGAPLMGGDSNAPDPLGFGLGGRAGVALYGIYAGVEGMYYVGDSGGSPYSASVNSDILGLDVGYGVTLSSVTIRLLVGTGNFTERVTASPAPGGAGGGGLAGSTGQSPSYNTLYLQPGITALFSLGTHYCVGADVNLLVLTSLPETFYSAANDLYSAFTFHGQVGARF